MDTYKNNHENRICLVYFSIIIGGFLIAILNELGLWMPESATLTRLGLGALIISQIVEMMPKKSIPQISSSVEQEAPSRMLAILDELRARKIAQNRFLSKKSLSFKASCEQEKSRFESRSALFLKVAEREEKKLNNPFHPIPVIKTRGELMALIKRKIGDYQPELMPEEEIRAIEYYVTEHNLTWLDRGETNKCINLGTLEKIHRTSGVKQVLEVIYPSS